MITVHTSYIHLHYICEGKSTPASCLADAMTALGLLPREQEVFQSFVNMREYERRAELDHQWEGFGLTLVDKGRFDAVPARWRIAPRDRIRCSRLCGISHFFFLNCLKPVVMTSRAHGWCSSQMLYSRYFHLTNRSITLTLAIYG